MSFVSDELANVLKSVYMKEDSGKDEGADSWLNIDKKNGVVSKEKRSKKHKHKKHSSKSKSRDKKKHKKRKHRSRSRSRSESRSRSKSRSSEREHSSKPSNRRSVSSNSRSKSPGVMEHDDFVLEKAENTIEVKVCKSTKEESGCTSKETVEAEPTPESDLKETLKETFESNCQEVSESKTLNIEEQRVSVQTSCSEEKGDSLASGSVTLSDQKDGSQGRNELQEKVTDTMWTESPLHSKSRSKSKERVPGSIRKNSASLSSSRSRSKEKVTDSKTKKSSSHYRSRSRSKEKGSNSKMKKSVSSSRSRSRSVGDKSFRNSKQRRSRSHSRGRKSKRRSKSRSSSKESSHHKRSRSRSHARNKSSKRRFKSRSHSGEQNCKRHVSKSRSRSYSNSKSRSRSPRHTRTHSRSRRKSPLSRNFRKFSPPHWRRGADSARGRSSSRSHRSRSKRRSSSRRRQSHSRSNSRRRFHRSQSRSRGRRSRTRSRSCLRNRKSRSKSRGRRNRSRSRSPSYSTGRSRRSTSRGRKRSKSRSRSKSGSKEKTEPNSSLSISSANTALESKVSSNIDKPGATSLSSQQAKVAQRAGGKTIAELTAFCKKLQEEKEGAGNETKEGTKTEEEESQTVTHHPFLVKEMPDITIPPVIFPVNMNKPSVPTVDPSKPLQEQFPVSCGSKHREKEVVDGGAGILANVDGSAILSQPKSEIPVFAPPSTEKFDISELVAKRMDAQRRLQTDPNDIEALLMLQEIQMKMQNWCQSNVKPGQFTGELVKNLLPKEHLQGGFQAWAKKDMFQNLTPVSGGIGMKLLQKMGWKPGQVIGKRGEGYAEPIALTVKIDRKGLSTGKEKATKKGAPAVLDLQGKHPVSALAEYCSKRKWQLPDYSLVFDQGPAHHKQFLFKVLVNGTEYQPAVVCGNKKQAKAQAAIFALKGLGLIPEDADISSL